MERTESSTSSSPAEAGGRRAAPSAVLGAIVPPAAELLIRALWATSRPTFLRPELVDGLNHAGTPFILAFWHCKLFLMQYALRGRRVTALISQHGDGELIARTMARFGHSAARGSSTRGGSRALREAIRVAEDGGSIAITPDGPRGPARVAKAGVVEIARATGLPILPASLAFSSCRRLASWDRFEVPFPFTRMAIAYGETIACARDADETTRERVRRLLEERLAALDAECAAAVGGGR